MNMIHFLQAAPVEPQPGFMQQYSFIIMIALMVLVLWLFMWRPEAKRRKQMQAFRDGLKKGDKIITAGASTARSRRSRRPRCSSRSTATSRCASTRTWSWPTTPSSSASRLRNRTAGWHRRSLSVCATPRTDRNRKNSNFHCCFFCFLRKMTTFV